MRGSRNLLWPSLIVVVALALPACTATDRGAEAASSSAQLTEPPDAAPAAPAAPDPAPAAPDPAPAAPDPAPAAPDPAPAAPDPAPAAPDPAPAAPDPAPRGERSAESPFALPGNRAAQGSVSPVAAACADVLEALTEAVVRYEVAALAEDAGSGSRSVAAAEMLAAIERARTAINSQGGLPSAAAPAISAVIALRGGLNTRATLDKEDAAPWRGARDDLQSWCRTHG